MTKQNKKGFTLIELSIVLVIIGLIIGGVLTGQQIMQNARITNTVNALQAFQSQVQTYAQNYGFLPGDDPNAQKRFLSGVAISTTSGNGIIEGTYDSADTTAETRLIWSHLRAATLIKEPSAGADTTARPPNPFNGFYGFQTNAFNNALSGGVLCIDNIPATAASAIDVKIDDGSATSGTLRGAPLAADATRVDVSTATPADYGTGSTFTMCVRL